MYIVAYSPKICTVILWPERRKTTMYKDKNGVIEDSFQAFLVDGANFTNEEEYPILREDMVPNVPPIKVMPFFKAINFQGDLSEYVIYFYSPDGIFERVRRNPKKYLNFFKRCKGIMGLDFSVHSDMPLVKQKAQLMIVNIFATVKTASCRCFGK